MILGTRCRAAIKDDKARRYRIEKWWWLSNVPLVAFVYFVFNETWEQISIPYLALVSIYALVITASGAEQAAEAAQQTKDN